MKKTLSIVLAVLTLLSVFSLTVVAADAPAITGLVSTFAGVELKWNSVEDAVAYLIYRDGVCIDTTKNCEYTDATVENGVTYVYSIAIQTKDGALSEAGAAQDIAYITPYCAHKGAKYVIDYPATVYAAGQKHKHCDVCGSDFGVVTIKQLVPAAPVINILSNRAKAIGIRWCVVVGADAYQVWRRGCCEKNYKLIATVKDGNTHYDYTAKSGTYYKYVVRAVNEAGKSAYSIKLHAKGIRRVDAPLNLTLANTTAGIRFSWDKVANADNYRVYRKEVDAESWTYLKSVKTTYYADLDTVAGVDYIYTVKAVCKKTASARLEKSIRRIENPELLTAKSTKEGILIDFEIPEGASGSYVYRKIGNGAWKKIGTINNTKSHTYLDVTAEKGVKYTYTVRAFDGKSISSYNAKGIVCTDKY